MTEANTRAGKYTFIIKLSNQVIFMWLNEGAHCLQREKPSEEVDRRMKT